MPPNTSRGQRRINKTADPGWPKHLEIDGLFLEGVHREVNLRLEDRITILSGPNGSGKTRLLSILCYVLAFEWEALASEPFARMTLTFNSGRSVNVRREQKDERVLLEVAVGGRATTPESSKLNFARDTTAHLFLPDYITRLDSDTWQDIRDGEILDLEELNDRFPWRPNIREDQVGFRISGPSPQADLQRIRAAVGPVAAPTFIETKRLDVARRRSSPHRRGYPRNYPHERIHDYIDQIQSQVQLAKANYTRISQRADSQFATKALAQAPGNAPATQELRRDFADLASLHSELLGTGLVVEAPGVEMRAGSLSRDQRQFISVFLSDWKDKLTPLLPVHSKLQLLQQVVGTKLKNKQLRLDDHGELVIETLQGVQIPVGQLSSGEQHLLALFATLLFGTNSGAVVLVDEPEISLHAEWKHAFLDDIRRVADGSNLQFVLATHSTGIINGQWDLVEAI